MIELWNKVLLEPMMNGLVVLSGALGGSFGLAIVVLTLMVNIVTLPLMLRQIKSAKAMQELQPKMKEMQKKYARDKQKLQQETLKLYKESGFNPLGCFLPLVIQMVIGIALYQSILQTLATTPERLLGLSSHLYPWSFIQQSVPAGNTFVGLNLAFPSLPLVILVMATMWLSQKMTTVPSADPQQKQMQSMMLWMMPMMLGFFFMTFPSGLALYVVVGNIFRIFAQYSVTKSWGGLATLIPGRAPVVATQAAGDGGKAIPAAKAVKELPAGTPQKPKPVATKKKEEGTGDGIRRSKRQNRKGGR